MKLKIFILILIYNFSAFAILPLDTFKTYSHPRFVNFSSNTASQLKGFTNEMESKGFIPNIKSVFYPFGGPDIIYPLMLFPQAKTYLLIGLEPINSVKSNVQIPKNLDFQLDSLFRRSFFITAEMKNFISNQQGVLPLFLAQIGLMKGIIKDIQYLNYSFGKTVKIIFTYQQIEKELWYIQTNVANQNLNNDLFKFIKDNNLFEVCMLKASSYCLHQNIFSKLRDFIITNANFILQDDTGIPLKYLNKNFEVHLFGNYAGPYGKEWVGYFQKDLYNMYQKLEHKKPIPFCYGYGCSTSPVTIILATRKPTN